MTTPFNPNPAIPAKPSTEERATRARTVLLAYYNNVEQEIITLLADVKHVCREEHIDFANCVRLADASLAVENSDEISS